MPLTPEIDVFSHRRPEQRRPAKAPAAPPSRPEKSSSTTPPPSPTPNDPVGADCSGSAWPAFGLTWYAAANRMVCFVPAAASGSSQQAGLNPSSNWDGHGIPLQRCHYEAERRPPGLGRRRVRSSLPGVCLWSQGETDAASPAGYQAALAGMIARFRSAYGSALPFSIFRNRPQQHRGGRRRPELAGHPGVAGSDSRSRPVHPHNFPRRRRLRGERPDDRRGSLQPVRARRDGPARGCERPIWRGSRPVAVRQRGIGRCLLRRWPRSHRDHPRRQPPVVPERRPLSFPTTPTTTPSATAPEPTPFSWGRPPTRAPTTGKPPTASNLPPGAATPPSGQTASKPRTSACPARPPLRPTATCGSTARRSGSASAG